MRKLLFAASAWLCLCMMATAQDMKTMFIGVEANNLTMNGVDWDKPITQPITLRYLQLNTSMGFGTPVTGFAEVLVYGVIQQSPSYIPGPQALTILGPDNPEFGPTVLYNPSGAFAHGYIGPSGIVFSTILKTNAPAAAFSPISTPLDIVVPAGSHLIIHANAYGPTTDVEMQGTLTYTSP